MTAFTFGEATTRVLAQAAKGQGGGAPRHAGVRRGSIEAGTFEDGFFAKPAKGECDRLIRMARVALDTGRRIKRKARGEGRDLTAPERLLAGLTAGAVRVYEELCTLARLNGGKVYPSYDRLASATALGRATVARAIQILEDAGFLIRQRRFRRVAGEGPGPRFEQTSNAYRPVAPKKLLSLLPRWLRPAPVPDDTLQHVADQAEEQERLKGQLSCRELAQMTASGTLGLLLARLGAKLDAILPSRESHSHSETLHKPFEKGI
ncbi:helix-turn-helix domain-containing protein [uncultured Sphingomonas sp.]|uniref:helix-turn-helix domain-containing protein n=1 Tax=uncultured Sphingomonas sp. TaxID=158754 RepID=UPI0025F2BF6A|nr:helix-turn-helix domain-containing protein [uncultured Sphingomonas sp.]